MGMVRTQILGVRLPPGTQSALDHAASDYGRSVSTMVEGILAEWLIAKGYMANPASPFVPQFQDEHWDYPAD